MKKALRIGYNRYYCDENFNEHIAFVKKNIANIDEITLFAEFCHYGYWDEEFTRKNTEILTRRIAQYREAGVKSVGINVLNTRGHTLDGWDLLPKTDLQHEVNEKGEESKSCLCVSNEAFEEYITKRFTAYAKTGTDFIWLDDDIRPGNGMRGCMCDDCIARFNKLYSRQLDRQALVAALANDKAIKQEWTKYQSDLIVRLIEVINSAIHAAAPAVKIGFMGIFKAYNESRNEHFSKVRPGGGYYDDRTPVDLFMKCLSVQEQISSYPDRIRDIQYEYEAFNYQSLDRSMHMSELETSLALMSGCNGVLYNNDIFYDRQCLLDMLASSGKKWDALTERNEGLKPAGVYTMDGYTMWALNQIGIPVTCDLDNAVCCFIEGGNWYRYDSATIEKILSKGAMTDGKGLAILEELGYADRCGGKIKKAYASGMAERFAAHPLCGKYAGHYRDAFMNFVYYHNNTGFAYELAPAEGAEVVSNLETITHNRLDCSLYAYEGKDGARFAADGYFFRNSIRTHGKKAQLGSILDWLSRDRLPVRVENETIKVMPTVRSDAEGNMTVMLANASFDKTGHFECEIRSDKKFYILGQNGKCKSVKQRKNGSSTVVTVDNLDGWNYVLLTNMK